jgi:hypothetical protein
MPRTSRKRPGPQQATALGRARPHPTPPSPLQMGTGEKCYGVEPFSPFLSVSIEGMIAFANPYGARRGDASAGLAGLGGCIRTPPPTVEFT